MELETSTDSYKSCAALVDISISLHQNISKISNHSKVTSVKYLANSVKVPIWLFVFDFGYVGVVLFGLL